MKYVVQYMNPNNIVLTDKVYTYETTRKSELKNWLQNARKYNGSYNILGVQKVYKNRIETVYDL